MCWCLNTWNHIALTFDGNCYRVYVNGSLKIEDSQTFKGQTPVAKPQLWIGRVDNIFQRANRRSKAVEAGAQRKRDPGRYEPAAGRAGNRPDRLLALR